MKKLLIILFSLLSTVVFSQSNFMQAGTTPLMSGTSFLTTVGSSTVEYTQIIADHLAVAAFNAIPSNWIDSVKKMQLGYIGESHSVAVRDGLDDLQTSNATYAVATTARPAAATTTNLRSFAEFPNNGTTWGNLGEYEWYKDQTARSYIQAGIAHINDVYETGRPMDVFGFGWCWDPNETASEMPEYVEATKEYIQYCINQNYKTKVVFTTGPVDGENASGETGWNKHLAYEVIRDSVYADSTRILFDFADILCYNNDGTGPTTATWSSHTYPIITTESLGSGNYAHMGPESGIRLAKAMWWMLARIAGWDGKVGVTLGTDILGGAGLFTSIGNWNTTDWTILNGVATSNGTIYGAVTMNPVPTDYKVSTRYRIQFDVDAGATSNEVTLAFTYRGGQEVDLIPEAIYTTGSYSYDFTTPATIPEQRLEIYNMIATSFSYTLDNLTIREIVE